MENFPNNYKPDDKQGAKSSQVKVLTKSEILEPRGIPSSATLLKLESSNIEDVREFKTRRYKVRARIHGT